MRMVIRLLPIFSIQSNRPISSSDELITVLNSLIYSSFDRLTPIDGPQELVLALGEQEQLITIGEDQSISFDDVGSLGALDPEDFLTMRLYANNDSSNVLWEYAFEYLNFYAVLDDDILPATDGAIEISADDVVVNLMANLVGFANRPKDSKYKIIVQWMLEGQGELENYDDSDDEYGVFKNRLTMPTQAGAIAKVSIRIIDDDSGDSQVFPLHFRTVPGLPKVVSAELSGTIAVSGFREALITGVAKDGPRKTPWWKERK